MKIIEFKWFLKYFLLKETNKFQADDYKWFHSDFWDA